MYAVRPIKVQAGRGEKKELDGQAIKRIPFALSLIHRLRPESVTGMRSFTAATRLQKSRVKKTFLSDVCVVEGRTHTRTRTDSH